MKHGVEVHPLPDHVDHQQQACLWRVSQKKNYLLNFSGHDSQGHTHVFPSLSYLKSKLVEEVVDEVFDEADDADVQVLPCDTVEDDPGGGRQQFVPQSEVQLMAVDGHLEGQQGEHEEVVLHGR